MILLDKSFYTIKKEKQKGRGIFAKKEIPNGTIVADYLGRLIKIAEEEDYEKHFGHYIMFYNDKASIVPQDIKAVGAHLINHSCMPNCGVLLLQKHIVFVSLRKIFPGEELTIDYEVEQSPNENFQYPCFCKSLFCRGTMNVSQEKEEKWYRFARKRQKADFNELEVGFGQQMKPLKKYPKFMKDSFGYPVFASLIKEPITIYDSQLLSIKILREKIKNTGQCLYFPKINYCLYGIADNALISSPKRINLIHKQGE
ncbi:MAG: SET domain-containing protein-lysine N-methyltransferase [Candidatus Gribaldobacteria bacterium]|nr:SET domain-containing protein-lysine N-methyltransferase [Candidatus Gribaldobacteria bacterium]